MVKGRTGAAIPFVLLFSLALYALAWGAFVSASAALRTGRAAVTVSELTAETQARLAGEIVRGPEWFADSLPVGHTGLRSDSAAARPWQVVWTRLDAEAWLVRATAWPGVTDLPGPPLSASRLAWALDPDTRILALADITVSDTAVVTMPTVPAGVSVGRVDSIGLGLLTVDRVSEGMSALVGTLTPRVVTRFGRCDLTVVENLADPLGTSACRGAVALRRVDGPVQVLGGTGHVLFAGKGDVTVDGGAHLRGLLLTEGIVRIVDGTFEGLIVAGGGVEISPGTTFVPDRAYARVALEEFRSARSFGRPLHPARSLWGG